MEGSPAGTPWKCRMTRHFSHGYSRAFPTVRGHLEDRRATAPASPSLGIAGAVGSRGPPNHVPRTWRDGTSTTLDRASSAGRQRLDASGVAAQVLARVDLEQSAS